MKQLLFLFTLLGLAQVVFSQQTNYNVYRIGRGEVFKVDYAYLDHLHADLLIAVPIQDTVQYERANLTGIIDLKEKVILDFQYRNIRKLRDDYNFYKGREPLLEISNGRGRALFKLHDNTQVYSR